MPASDILFRLIVFHGPHSLPETGSSYLPETQHIRKALSNRGIVRVCLLNVARCTAYFDGCFELEEHGLFEEDLSGFETESPNFWLEQFDILAAIFEQFVDDFIDIYLFGYAHCEMEKDYNLNLYDSHQTSPNLHPRTTTIIYKAHNTCIPKKFDDTFPTSLSSYQDASMIDILVMGGWEVGLLL